MKIYKLLLCILASAMLATVPFSAYTSAEHPVPKDGTDYSQISKKDDGSKSKCSGALEATEEEMRLSRLEPKKAAFPAQRQKSVLTSTGWYHLANMNSFYYYGQEHNNTCGPACVKMVLKYLVNLEYLEDTISSGCGTVSGGTSLYNMQTYINGQQHAYSYNTAFGSTKTQMKIDLYSGVVSYNEPPIVGLKEEQDAGWAYDLNAHFIVVYGITSDKSMVAIADPWAGYINDPANRWRDMPTDKVYTAYNKINAGYMY